MSEDEPRRILVVEDHDDIRQLLAELLESVGFDVVSAATASAARRVLAELEIDLLVLDLRLPDADGMEVLAENRAGLDVPVVVVSARAGAGDRIRALQAGADDYLEKPFLHEEFVARVRAVVRRSRGPLPTRAVHGPLSIDRDAREVRVGGESIQLTRLEFDLLDHFVRHPRQALSRADLMRRVWSADPEWLGESTVTEHVHRLRGKLEEAGADPECIQTVRGVGYRYDPQALVTRPVKGR